MINEFKDPRLIKNFEDYSKGKITREQAVSYLIQQNNLIKPQVKAHILPSTRWFVIIYSILFTSVLLLSTDLFLIILFTEMGLLMLVSYYLKRRF